MSYYRISYTRETEKALSQQRIFKEIDNNVLCNLDDVRYYIENPDMRYGMGYDMQDLTSITDRDTATDYIKQHRSLFEYIGYDTGNINRLVCVEMDEEKHNKATGALYDHPEHGLIWLEMY
jgi:hypothetical protein